MIYRALTIAGSDSGGGAGIQADLKTFQELDVFGTTAITALTAQNTHGVHAVYAQDVQVVEAQMEAVLSDIGTDAVKTGMLFSSEIILAVCRLLQQFGTRNIVVDPVMVAKGGHKLLQPEAVRAVRTHLLPLATVITPNLPEAEELLQVKGIASLNDMKDAAKDLHLLGAQYVLIKGGHLPSNQSTDVLYDGRTFTVFDETRIETKHTHGTGCTFSAAIAAELAKGNDMLDAVQTAKSFISLAIRHAQQVGSGIGPTHHAAYRNYRKIK